MINGDRLTLSTVIVRARSDIPISYPRPIYICRVCLAEFNEYKGMRRVGRSSIGYCPDHLVPGLTRQEMNCWRAFGISVEFVNGKVRIA